MTSDHLCLSSSGLCTASSDLCNPGQLRISNYSFCIPTETAFTCGIVSQLWPLYSTYIWPSYSNSDLSFTTLASVLFKGFYYFICLDIWPLFSNCDLFLHLLPLNSNYDLCTPSLHNQTLRWHICAILYTMISKDFQRWLAHFPPNFELWIDLWIRSWPCPYLRRPAAWYSWRTPVAAGQPSLHRCSRMFQVQNTEKKFV